MRILQIALGEIPSEIEDCMKSVRQWASSHAMEYKLITQAPGHLTKYAPCIISNEIRVQAAADDPLFYIDWDIILEETFTIPPRIDLRCDRRNPDAFFISYSPELFQGIQRLLEGFSARQRFNRSTLWNLIKRNLPYEHFPEAGYTHLVYHRRQT